MIAYFWLPETASFRRRRQAAKAAPVEVASSSSSSTAKFWKHPNVLKTTGLYGALCFVNICYIELLPIFFGATGVIGGLDFSSTVIGICFSVQGAGLFLFQLVCYPRLARAYGAVTLMKIGTGFAIILVGMPVLASFIPAGLARFAFLIPVMVIVMAPQSMSFTSSILMVNNASSDEIRGQVNGLGQTLGSGARAVGPVFIGVVWTFMADQGQSYLAFVFLCAAATVLFLMSLSLDQSLSYPLNSKEGEFDVPLNVIAH